MLIEIEKIQIKDRIRKDFGNIQELADDIRQNGLINPPVVVPETDGTFTLLTGERRIRAMKQLGYKQVEVRTWTSLNDEQKLNIEISENEARKDFSKSERMEYALKLAKIESAKARERQATSTGGSNPQLVETFPQGEQIKVRDVVAAKTGIGSGKQFEKEKYIYENQDSLTPEDFADWDEGKLSTNKAYQKIKAKVKEQEEQLQQATNQMNGYKLKADKAASKVDELKQKIHSLENDIDELNKREQSAKSKIVTKEVKPSDYDSIKSDNEILKNDNARMTKEYKTKCQELFDLKNKLKAIEEDSTRNKIENEMKNDCIFFCARCDDFIKKVGGYAYLSDKLNSLPEMERKSYLKCVQAISAWAENILSNIDQ